jgi:hypothetical protein
MGVATRAGQPIAASDLARSHIERCLQDVSGVDRVVPDADGDYCYCIGTASCYFVLDGNGPVLVRQSPAPR